MAVGRDPALGRTWGPRLPSGARGGGLIRGVLGLGSGVFHHGRGILLFWGVWLSGLKGPGLELPIPPRTISTCWFPQALAEPAVPGQETNKEGCHPFTALHCIRLWCLLSNKWEVYKLCLKTKKTLLVLPLCLNQLNLFAFPKAGV